MSEYIYGRYIPYDDRRCHECGMYLKDHDWIGCPYEEVSGEEALLELRREPEHLPRPPGDPVLLDHL